jgi:hypothetical protein
MNELTNNINNKSLNKINNKKLQINLPDDIKAKHSQQNTKKLNPTAHAKVYTL